MENDDTSSVSFHNISAEGQVKELIWKKDWSKTSLGSMDSWPRSLKNSLSMILEIPAAAIIFWGPDKIQLYNEGYSVIMGPRHPQHLGSTFQECWPEAFEAINPWMERVLQKGETVKVNRTLVPLTRFGFTEECYFSFSFSPLWDNEGKIIAVLQLVTEVTEAVLGERRALILYELSNLTAFAKTTQEATQLATGVLSKDTADLPFCLIYAIDSADQLKLKLSESTEILFHHQLFPKEIELRSDAPTIIPEIFQAFQEKKLIPIENLMTRMANFPSEEWPDHPKHTFASPILASDQSVIVILVIGISPRLVFDRHYKTFLQLLSDQLKALIINARAYEDERKKAEALVEIDKAKTAFFSNVSHEFRTPITLILGPIEDLLNNNHSNLHPYQRSQIEVVHRNSLRLLKLVNNLLDFSKIEAKRVEAIYEPIELASFTADLASSFRFAIEKVGMKFIIDCNTLPELVYVDKDMWEKIVLNLVSNAFKYTLEGEIKVTLGATPTTVELIVSDTGTGIPEQELPKVFQRFHRVQGAKGRTHEGTGIGLALVQELVKLHGGSVEVKSIFGKGSSFSVNIPLGSKHIPQDKISGAQKILPSTIVHTEAYVEETLRWNQTPLSKETMEEQLLESSTQESSARKIKEKILFADDNADMRDYIKKLLEEYYDVIIVSNGKEALDSIYKFKPDLLLSDVMMPVIDGFELLKILRNDPNFQTIPVILISARAGEGAKTSGIELGADDYLTKPFSVKELQARVRTQLNLSKMRTKLLHDLEFSNKELEIFSSAVSHDLRAPLRSMAGFSKILFDEYFELIDQKGKDYLQRIISSAQKMGALIDGLLNLSRLSRGEMHTKMVNLSKIVQSIAEDFQSIDPSRQVDFIIESNITLEGDSQFYQIALQNLISNAWKFTSKKEKSRIEFGVENRNNKKIYFIKDNGVGFDMKFSNKLFGIFQRLHSVQEFDGTGIGLATVQRIIQRHGGSIWAEGKINQGATFYFTF